MLKEQKLLHICEVCGKTQIMTPEQAFDEGWDYPPMTGTFGTLGPRTCGDCAIADTLWWALETRKITRTEDLTPEQRVVLERILNEPASIMP